MADDKITKVAPPVAQPSASEQLKPSPAPLAPVEGAPMGAAPATPPPGVPSAVDEIKPVAAPEAKVKTYPTIDNYTPEKVVEKPLTDEIKPVEHNPVFVDLSRDESAVDTDTDATAEQPKSSFAEAYEKANKKPTDEDLEAERKRARSRAVIAAIGDGISSLSNLFFTTKGAPNMYDANNAQSKRIKDEWDDYVKRWEDKRKEYDAGLLAAQAKDADAAKEKYNRELEERKLKMAEQKSMRDADNDEYDHLMLQERINGQRLKNIQDKIKADGLEKWYAKEMESRVNRNNRANTGRGGRGGGGRGGSNNKYYGSIVGADGKDVAKGTKADYDEFADRRAQEEKVPRYEKRITRILRPDGSVDRMNEKVSRRSSSQIASDVANKTNARRAAEAQAAQAKAKQQQASAKPKPTSNGKKPTGGFAWD